MYLRMETTWRISFSGLVTSIKVLPLLLISIFMYILVSMCCVFITGINFRQQQKQQQKKQLNVNEYYDHSKRPINEWEK